MKSYKIIENGNPIEKVEIEKPIPVGDEILVKTVSCGVCHSDVHIYEGFFDLGGGAKLPTPAKKGGKILWFCEDHVKEYNKKWDFFEGMSQNEIEDFIFKDIVGHRKTQKFGSRGNFFHKLWNNAIEDELLNLSKFKKSISQENQEFTEKQIIALKKMELKPNISWIAIKEQFKKLVKKYHPDMNAGDKRYEEKLKEITIAYSYLKTSLSEKQKVKEN